MGEKKNQINFLKFNEKPNSTNILYHYFLQYNIQTRFEKISEFLLT